MKTAFIGLATLLCGASLAQFRDDFNGNALGDHWSIFVSEGDHPNYNVSGGYLNITGFRPDGDYLHSLELASLVGAFGGIPSFADFEVNLRVGWDSGTLKRFGVILYAPPGRNHVAGTTWSIERGTSTVRSSVVDGGSSTIEGPLNGFHTIRMTRTGSVFEAYFDDTLVHASNSATALRVNRVSFLLQGFNDESFGGISVDYVEVVPEPATLAVLGAGVLSLGCRRWRKHKKDER